jgi:hypothetical protein
MCGLEWDWVMFSFAYRLATVLLVIEGTAVSVQRFRRDAVIGGDGVLDEFPRQRPDPDPVALIYAGVDQAERERVNLGSQLLVGSSAAGGAAAAVRSASEWPIARSQGRPVPG